MTTFFERVYSTILPSSSTLSDWWMASILETGSTLMEPEELGHIKTGGSPVIGLTERERRFAEAYVQTTLELGRDMGAGAIAYRRAFPASQSGEKAIYRVASHLLRAPRVQALIAHLREEMSHATIRPLSHLVQEIEKIAYSNIFDYGKVDGDGNFTPDLRTVSHRQAAAIQKIEVRERVMLDGTIVRSTKFELYSKSTAQDQLARIHGAYQDKVNLNFSVEDLDRAIATLEHRVEQAKLLDPNLPPVVDTTYEDVTASTRDID